MFSARVGYWNGACYECLERYTLKASTMEDAIEEVQAMLFSDDEDYDVQVLVEDQDGNIVHTEYFEYSVAKEQQEDMDETWEDEGEFSTDHVGIKDGTWYRWSTNGGSRGAHDRMHGSGRWIERYEMPRRIESVKALDWLVKKKGMDTDEAINEMADADNSGRTLADLIMDVGQCLWRLDGFTGVYRIQDCIYTIRYYDVHLVDDPVDFIAKYEGTES